MTNQEILDRLKATSEGRPNRPPLRIDVSALVVPVALIAGAIWLCSADPGAVVVNEQGQITNKIDTLRERIQGKRFWQDQLRFIDAEFEWRQPQPVQSPPPVPPTQEWDHVIAKLHAEYPELKPSPTQQRINALREEADALEIAEIGRRFDEMNEQRVASLHRIRTLVVARVSSYPD